MNLSVRKPLNCTLLLLLPHFLYTHAPEICMNTSQYIKSIYTSHAEFVYRLTLAYDIYVKLAEWQIQQMSEKVLCLLPFWRKHNFNHVVCELHA